MSKTFYYFKKNKVSILLIFTLLITLTAARPPLSCLDSARYTLENAPSPTNSCKIQCYRNKDDSINE